MNVVDANLLITFSSAELVGLPGQAISAFLRVMINPKLPAARFSLLQAVETVDLWLAHPHIQVLTPGDRYWPIFRSMIVEGRAAGPLVSHARLAALTIEHGGVLYTADRDFARFPGLRWKNPLA